MLLIYLTLIMVIIHLAGTLLSFSKRTFPKSIGYLIAIYEMIFYIILVSISKLYYNEILIIIAYMYLIIHVIGGIAYLKGSLSKIYSPVRLKYYGIYELVEMIYLLVILI
ncbi:hypothetical protein [Sulfurisphaera ohwakuensis]|uniref:Uncharacterized protein n=1 Tax=Sulfurisphaera ohwakuensis TaxID=69656 RepID=A0A650CL45_SULOH|nr:hypothetical protein [Sulfurisphaera ohwakuensis]MBB5254304.1 hypothetical protein [Sulfurisphaera ohwakuensis]QGR18197.1 hypothetical protein D1869_14125 [Sulfurisphaera ohwakuensis]